MEVIMELDRIHFILKNKEKTDVFYDERPVWIQEVNSNIAKVGFIDNFEEKDVFIDDLYERNLYN
jgi:H-type small acid-soluble spore protein